MKKEVKLYINGVPQIRPWHRFIARYIDLILYLVVVLIILTLFLEEQIVTLKEKPILNILFVAQWIPIESLLLSTWGTTPGKWLFEITVRDTRNRKLTFWRALYRSFQVWIAGMWFGIPIVVYFAYIISYIKLENHKITFWDEGAKTMVHHKKIGNVKLSIIIFILIIIIKIYFSTIITLLNNIINLFA